MIYCDGHVPKEITYFSTMLDRHVKGNSFDINKTSFFKDALKVRTSIWVETSSWNHRIHYTAIYKFLECNLQKWAYLCPCIEIHADQRFSSSPWDSWPKVKSVIGSFCGRFLRYIPLSTLSNLQVLSYSCGVGSPGLSKVNLCNTSAFKWKDYLPLANHPSKDPE